MQQMAFIPKQTLLLIYDGDHGHDPESLTLSSIHRRLSTSTEYDHNHSSETRGRRSCFNTAFDHVRLVGMLSPFLFLLLLCTRALAALSPPSFGCRPVCWRSCWLSAFMLVGRHSLMHGILLFTQ